MSARKLAGPLYMTTLAVLIGLSLRLLLTQPVFDTNILNLAPPLYRDRLAEDVVRGQLSRLSSQVAIVVRSQRSAQAEAAATELAAAMQTSNLFSEIRGRLSPTDLKPLQDAFLSYPFQLTAPPQASTTAELIAAIQGVAFSPEGLQWLGAADRDPLLMFPRYLAQALGDNPRFSIRNGFIHTDGEGSANVLILARLKGSALDRATQEGVASFFRKRLAIEGSTIIPAGIVFFAQESAQRTEQEVTLISLVTLLALVSVLWWVFRSLRPVALIAASIVSSFLVALLVTHHALKLLGMGELHLITVGFGSSLLGVCIDYAIHYFVALRLSWQKSDPPPLRRIGRGLILGYATTVVAFMGVACAPFPGLQQLALFCVVGLTVSLLNVFLLFPLLASAPGWDTHISRLSGAVGRLYSLRYRGLILALMLAALIPGLRRLTIEDDIRVLNKPSRELVTAQQEAAKVAGLGDGGTIALVEGASDEDVLAREEALRERLDSLKDRGQLQGYRSISILVPSRTRQDRNYHALRSLLIRDPGAISAIATALRLPEQSRKRLESVVASPTPADYLTIADCIQTEACAAVKDLWSGSVEGRIVSVVALQGPAAEVIPALIGLPGVRAINQTDSISSALASYRRSAMASTAIFYGLIGCFLALRYGVRRATRIFASPVLGAVAALACLGWAGVPVNVFSIFALMVLLGVSVDYSLFFAEDHQGSQATGLAVTLSALTTILSFGLLAWSSTPALQSFGIVLSVGVFVAALASSLAASQPPGPSSDWV